MRVIPHRSAGRYPLSSRIGAARHSSTRRTYVPPGTLLPPHANTYSFDPIMTELFKTLQKRGFTAPGLTVTFHTYGPGLVTLDRVEGEDFYLVFGRIQGAPPGLPFGTQWNDTGAVHQLVIPTRKGLTASEDPSRPRLRLYVGETWNTDWQTLLSAFAGDEGSPSTNRRLFLEYDGSRDGRPGWFPPRHSPAPYLAQRYDLSGGHVASGDATEPRAFETHIILKEFTDFFAGVLARLRA